MIVVGGHPVAGTEKSGPENGFASLFKGRWCILTPDENSSSDAVARLTAMWEHCGMKVDTMEPAHHDKVMAAVSHLPQLIAYSIVGTVADLEGYEHKEIIKYSAGGFRDFTRIAGSDPTMWRDVFLTNKQTVLELIQRFVEDLIALERNIRWDEGDKLFDLFKRCLLYTSEQLTEQFFHGQKETLKVPVDERLSSLRSGDVITYYRAEEEYVITETPHSEERVVLLFKRSSDGLGLPEKRCLWIARCV